MSAQAVYPDTVRVRDRSTAMNCKSDNALREQPIPLINPERKLIVLWSAKSACTVTYSWFAIISGYEEEIRTGWPHDHRQRLTSTPEYRQLLQSDVSDYHVLRIIRDPYQRAVSIFHHALKYGAAFADAEIEKWNKRKSFDRTGISFRQFLNFLTTIDISRSNVHFRQQLHPFEKIRPPTTVINVSKQNLFSELNKLEKDSGWSVTELASKRWLSNIGERHNASTTSGLTLDFETPLTRSEHKRSGLFPTYDQLLTKRARRKIAEIYADDFSAYREYL